MPDEDLVQSRLDQLEPADPGPARDPMAQDFLMIGALAQQKHEAVGSLLDALDGGSAEPAVVAFEAHRQHAFALLPLQLPQPAIENLARPGDEADPVAHALGLVHQVRREQDGRSLLVEFAQDAGGGMAENPPGEMEIRTLRAEARFCAKTSAWFEALCKDLPFFLD